MTIHHDKMAYGRLKSLNEEFSSERLDAMVKSLEEEPKREYDRMGAGQLYNPAEAKRVERGKRVRSCPL